MTSSCPECGAYPCEVITHLDGSPGVSFSSPEKKTQKRSWVLCHPVAPDAHFTFEQNMAHTLKVARICHDAGFKVCVPWWADCHYLDDKNAEHRAAGLAMDCEIITHLRRVILTGHRLSSGMGKEIEALYKVGGQIIDAIGVKDADLSSFLKDNVEEV